MRTARSFERVIGPGPDNPLGRYAFYLGWPSYMIHGTNKPAGVGLRSSHGCIRLYPEDIELLFNMAPVGTKVRVVNEPFVFGWQDDQLYLQAFDVLEDDPRDWKKAQKKLVSKSLGADIQKELKKRGEEMNWDLVATAAHGPRGIPVSISNGGEAVEQVVASAHARAEPRAGGRLVGRQDGPAGGRSRRSARCCRIAIRRAPSRRRSSSTPDATPAAGNVTATSPPKTGT